MYFDDKKHIVETIMSKRKPSGERTMEPTLMKKEHVTDEHGVEDGRHLAAQDMIAAHHEKSPHKLMEAMKNFIDIHMGHHDDAAEEPSAE